MSSLLETFREILAQHDLLPEDILADGDLYRCPTRNKPYKRNGAYIAHQDRPATLWWCNWETGDQGTFHAEGERALSPVELSAWHRRQQAMRKQRDEECARRHAEAAQQAHKRLRASFSCSERHAYLSRKVFPRLRICVRTEMGCSSFRSGTVPARCRVCNISHRTAQNAFLRAARFRAGNSLFPARQKNRWHFVRATPPGPAFTLPVHGRSM